MLGRAATVPALAVLAWVVAAAPLLVLGPVAAAYRPLPAVLLAGLVLALLLRLPAPAALPAPVALPAPAAAPAAVPGQPRGGRAPRWPGALTALVAAGVALASVLLSGEHVVLRRDPGTYAQTAWWLAEHGRLAVPDALAAVGGPSPAVTAASPGFYADASTVHPQFLPGTTAVLAAFAWVAGWRGILAGSALVTGFALLAVGGLAARLLGRVWAPLVTLVVGVSFPVLHVARSPYSEPLAMLLVSGGLCLLVDALRAQATRAAVLGAWAGGLVLGGAALVRVDAPRETALLVPLAGWLVLRRHPGGAALAGGLAAGTAAGVALALTVSRDYLADNALSVLPLLALLAVSVVATAGAVAAARRLGCSGERAVRAAARLAPLAAGLLVLLGVVLAARPLVWQARRSPTALGSSVVAGIQSRTGLAVDPGRTYDERSVAWLSWWLGVPLLVLALAGAALLTVRLLRGRDPAWWGLWLAGVGTTVQVLARPGITPDHPWADRRFAHLVVTTVALLAAYAARELLRAARPRLRALHPAAVMSAAVMSAAVVLLPVAAGSADLAPLRTEVGELAALRRSCAAFAPGEVALMVDGRAAREWPPGLRGCGVPAAVVVPGGLGQAVEAARRAGSSPVLVGAEGPVRLTGWSTQHVVDAVVREDDRVLTRRPTRTVPLDVDLWLSRPTG